MVLDTRDDIPCDSFEYLLLIFTDECRMKPTRIRMCHSLVMNYGLYKKMEIFVRVQLFSH